jgi:hypothetical protein
MAHTRYGHHLLSVIDLIDNPIGPDAQPPQPAAGL